MSFYGNNYERPKLTETKMIRKIIDTQIVEIPTEQKIFNNMMQFIINNYKLIICFLIVIVSLYWRYEYTKKKKETENINYENEIFDTENFIIDT